MFYFFFSSRRRHTRLQGDWSSDVCSSDLDAAHADGTVRPGHGRATRRIGPLTPLRCVDAIVSGTHERGTSHYDVLRAFQGDEVLAQMEREADALGYRTHEFGDSVFLSESVNFACAGLGSRLIPPLLDPLVY